MTTSDNPEFEKRLKDTLSTAYEIDRELGGGGMSRVFVATDRILGRKIVIKVLSPELTAEVNRGRFRREMQVAAQLQHPHIVPLLSAGEQDDLLYFTMPFIKGESLKTAIEKDGGMSVAEVLRVLYHVGEALDYAHEAGIVHRDIKPANILRSGSYALITDFGVAKALNAAMSSQTMTSTGMAIGTPAYMAPEQLAGDPAADHRVDIYAVGLLAYELLYGKSPYAGATPQRILAAVLTQDPLPLIEVKPEVPQALSDVVMRCLSKEPDLRPATAKELLISLDMFSNNSGEVRTMEPRVAHIVHTPTPTSAVTPVVIRDHTGTSARQTPTREAKASEAEAAQTDGQVDAGEAEAADAAVFAAGSLSGEVDYLGYQAPKKSRAGMLAGVVTILALAVAGGFLWSQRGGDGARDVAGEGSEASLAMIADSASLQSPAATDPDSSALALAPVVDSQAIRDSIRRVARAEAAKKAAAREDSLRRAQAPVTAPAAVTPEVRARNAAAAMLSNQGARATFARGATRMGGVLGTQRRGDLQTQIDALQPFLSDAGISYEHFKILVQGAGINMFDEFGRMIPDALQQFASGG